MASFDQGYLKYCGGRYVSTELKPLLAPVYHLIHTSPVDLHALKGALSALMSFLSEPANRTDANCRAVDMFFTMEDHWRVRWETLPDDFRELLNDVGGILHDTFGTPEVAENFASTPEQLRDRAEKLNVTIDRKA